MFLRSIPFYFGLSGSNITLFCSTALECEKKWKNLKDNFTKKINEEKEERRSGAGTSKRKRWYLMESMAFLKSYETKEQNDRESNFKKSKVGWLPELTAEDFASAKRVQAAQAKEAAEREASEREAAESEAREQVVADWDLEIAETQATGRENAEEEYTFSDIEDEPAEQLICTPRDTWQYGSRGRRTSSTSSSKESLPSSLDPISTKRTERVETPGNALQYRRLQGTGGSAPRKTGSKKQARKLSMELDPLESAMLQALHQPEASHYHLVRAG